MSNIIEHYEITMKDPNIVIHRIFVCGDKYHYDLDQPLPFILPLMLTDDPAPIYTNEEDQEFILGKLITTYSIDKNPELFI